MTGDQWQAAWKLFQAGSSVAPDQIHSFLDSTAGDPVVRAAVLEMLGGGKRVESTVETLDRVGQRIGRYVLTDRLGEGGMGEVYAAHDSELGRSVAVKLMAATPLGTSSSVERFVHEAKAASALNHPNIVTVHEVIHSTSRLAIVMERVDGVALRQLCGSPLPADRVLNLGEQIARALAAAHARGIVHCDVKPENLMVRPDGFVKVLDFGLARDLGSVTNTSVVPAGTLRYMSPEQSRGEPPSPASDIFSLGIVLYELAGGRHPFEAGSIFDTLKALNQAAPQAPSSLNAHVPADLDALILRMLAKDPNGRPSASDVARILESRFTNRLATFSHAAAKQRPAHPSRWLLWIAAAVALLAAALGIGWTAWQDRWGHGLAEIAGPPIQLDLDVDGEVSQLAISPDGSQIVFLKGNQLMLRRLDQSGIGPLPATEGASYPFFSPDGKWVAFFSGGKLRKVAVTGGAAVTLCAAQSGRGGSWGDDGFIVASLNSTGGLSQVPSSGGSPRPLTNLKGESSGITSHRWPQVLPHSRAVLFTATVAGGAIGSLRVLPKNGGVQRTLIENTPYGRYIKSGYLVYYQSGKLFAAPFSLDRLEFSGPAVLLADRVAADTVRGAIFEVSLSGTVVYRRGDGETSRVLSWVDGSGAIHPLSAKPAAYLTPRLSPDGERLAIAMSQGGEQNLWIYDFPSDTMKRLTFDSETQLLPVWTPDGEFVAFRSGSSLGWTRSDGSGKLGRLDMGGLNPLPSSFSPDGKWLAFAGDDPDTGLDLYIVPVERSVSEMQLGKPQLLLRQPGGQYAPAISPDGRWLAYSSDESGRAELYVTEFSPGHLRIDIERNARWQVSNEGGVYAAWSLEASRLFYRSADRHVMIDPYLVKGATFLASKPRPWATRRLAVAGGFASFDVAPDGSRVVGIFESEESSTERDLRILLNVRN